MYSEKSSKVSQALAHTRETAARYYDQASQLRNIMEGVNIIRMTEEYEVGIMQLLYFLLIVFVIIW